MGRRNRKRQRAAEQQGRDATSSRPHNDVQDPALRLIALQPARRLLAITVGQQIKLVDLRTGTLITLDGEQHTAAVRVCEFDPSGKLLLTGGDDKVAKIWDTTTGTCLKTLQAPKKVSAGVFSPDSQYIVFADKFGDVLVAKVGGEETAPSLLLSHFSSFIMSLEVTPDQKFVISCDRDSKIRVSSFPADPLKGSYEIQAFCLGHSNFVTDSALLKLDAETLLLTSGGDGTVRLWQPSTGALLHTLQLGQIRLKAPAAEGQIDSEGDKKDGIVNTEVVESSIQNAGHGKEDGTAEKAVEEKGDPGEVQEADADDDCDDDDDSDDDELAQLASVSSLGVPPRDQSDYAPVLSLAVASDRSTIAATVEGEQEVVLLSFDPENRSLTEASRILFPDVSYPASVSFDEENRLWVVGGVPLQTSSALHIGVAHKTGDGWAACTGTVLTDDLRASLECRSEEEEKALQEGVQFEWYSEHLKKKSYTQEELEFRKRQRNDFKESSRLFHLKKAEAAAGNQST